MILTDLTRCLRERRRMSLVEAAALLGAAPEALEPMLVRLERKGLVRKAAPGPACGKTCCKCDPAMLCVYEWIAA